MTKKPEPRHQSIYLVGGIFTLLVLAGVILDVAIGSMTGADLTVLPKTAVERFDQFQNNALMGLYNLDCLNMVNQIFMIPVYFALYVAHRRPSPEYSLLALIVFLAGSILMVAGNTSLTMLDLSQKYAGASSDQQKMLLAAAGEAMLAKGSHGSASVLLGFALPNLAGILMSLVMLKGKVFSKTIGVLGITGSTLLLSYIVLVTFAPAIEKQALLFSMPGGLMMMAWMILFAIKLIRLGKKRVQTLPL